jgi:hypothetical protein
MHDDPWTPQARLVTAVMHCPSELQQPVQEDDVQGGVEEHDAKKTPAPTRSSSRNMSSPE